MMNKTCPKAARAMLILAACALLCACASMPGTNSNARPGDYASNYFSVPMSALYPGNYPQSAESSISSR